VPQQGQCETLMALPHPCEPRCQTNTGNAAGSSPQSVAMAGTASLMVVPDLALTRQGPFAGLHCKKPRTLSCTSSPYRSAVAAGTPWVVNVCHTPRTIQGCVMQLPSWSGVTGLAGHLVQMLVPAVQ
jgi:hypothetical protein